MSTDARPWSDSFAPPSDPRAVLRRRLIQERDCFAVSPQGLRAAAALTHQLEQVLAELAPECLGVYWPLGSEFNAARAWIDSETGLPVPMALPFAERSLHTMHYRRWDGAPCAIQDECGIATAQGERVVPDVVLVPCVGYTQAGHRLGYGAGYFDRYLAAHPQITTVGVAWSVGALPEVHFQAQPHDVALMLIVTEEGVVV